jgi:protein gp37
MNPKLPPEIRAGYAGGTYLCRDWLKKPLHVKKPAIVGVQFMGDLFHASVPFDWSLKVFSVMQQAKQHTFIVCTKRPERALEFCRQWGLMPSGLPSPACSTPSGEIWPTNVWLLVSVESQETADTRVPILLQIPAPIRGLSIEPLLGLVYLTKIANGNFDPYNCLQRWKMWNGLESGIDWVIVGGETGPGARMMESDWARSLREQCKTARVPFFFKKHGTAWCKSFGVDPKYRENGELDGEVLHQMPEVAR